MPEDWVEDWVVDWAGLCITNRRHQGRAMGGQTPLKAFVDGLKSPGNATE